MLWVTNIYANAAIYVFVMGNLYVRKCKMFVNSIKSVSDVETNICVNSIWSVSAVIESRSRSAINYYFIIKYSFWLMQTVYNVYTCLCVYKLIILYVFNMVNKSVEETPAFVRISLHHAGL